MGDAKPDAILGWVPTGVGPIFKRQFVERGLDKFGIKFIAEGSLTEDDILNQTGDAALGIITSHHYSAAHDSPDLRSICIELGFGNVETHIARGNVVFESRRGAATVKAKLESRLLDYAGKPVGMVVRSAYRACCSPCGQPVPQCGAYVAFLNAAPPRDSVETVKGRANEELRLVGHRQLTNPSNIYGA